MFLYRLALLGKLLLAMALVGTGCTNTDIVHIEKEYLFERQQIVAEVCAPPPTADDVPYKILFVIDTSLSNAWNDPAELRELAVRNAISGFIDKQTVSFGIITFSDEPRLQTFGFTRDLQILNGAIENVGNAQGGTNYSDTLWAVISFIKDDLATLSIVEASRTHYLVFWLSDGFPTVGVTDTTALLPAVTHLLDLTKDRVADIQFNTAFLGAEGETDQGMVADAVDLLTELAELGNGEFSSIPAGAEFDFDIELEKVTNHFEFTYAVASNRNTILDAGQPAPDSDADGIADQVEISYGLDPTRADSDQDGFRDGIEWMAHVDLDPLVANPGCESGDLDTDRDGLRDCEELVLGTLPCDPDSDDDRILDEVEVMMGTSPVRNDTSLDDDLDNISNQDEIRFHLDPKIPNSAEEVGEWAYRYDVREKVKDCVDCFETPPCYELRIDNLVMAETLETGAHPKGVNNIEVIVAFRGSSSDAFVRASIQGRVLVEDDLWEPPNGRFDLGNSDFSDEISTAEYK
jgi:VWA domain-containing protein